MGENDPLKPLDFALEKPAFKPCTAGCGQQTTGGGMCWECMKVAEAREVRAAEMRHLLATIPLRYRDAAFHDLPVLGRRVTPSTVLAGAPTSPKVAPWVVIAGPPGAGKTTLACAILRAYAAVTPGRSRYQAAHPLGRARISHRSGDGEPEIVDVSIGAAVLLLDDVGSEPHERTINALPDVVRERHANSLPTILTTGLTGPEIRARYDAGISRRILEKAHVIQLGSPTRAQAAAAPERRRDGND